MACCEANYHWLLRIFPKLQTVDQRRLGLACGRHSEVLLTVLEQTRYTTLLSIKQGPLEKGDDTNPLPENLENLLPSFLYPPTLVVRLYHDAKVAEVISCDNNRRVKPRNIYPNKQMFQPDEKRQWNNFLEDWLAQCRQYGYSLDEEVSATDVVCE